MNKIVIGLLVAVCLLGFALILLNERMDTKVAPPVIAENVQPPLHSVGISSDLQQPPQAASKTAGAAVSGDDRKAIMPNNAAEVAEDVPETIQPAIVNKKGLDEVLSERASEVQAPNQQASIVQQTSVTDLLVESPPLPKIITDMPIVPEPQPLDNTNQSTDSEKKESLNKQPAAVNMAKVQDVSSGEAAKQDSSLASVSTPKSEVKSKDAPKNPADDKSNKAKVIATPKSKTLTVTLFTVFTRENGATVRLRTNAPIAYSSAQLQNPRTLVKELQNPDRLMVDLTGSVEIKDPAIPNNVIVNKVRVGKMADRARIVVDLKEKPKKIRVKIAEKNDGFDIFLDR